MGIVARPKGRIQTDHNFAVVRFPGASKRFSGVYMYKIPLAPSATLVSNQISVMDYGVAATFPSTRFA